MRLYLVRHAEAASGEPDDLRPLTASGREAARALATQLAAEGLRAAVAGRGEQVVVVGHQPDCGHIAAELSGGPEPAFPPAGVVVLEL